jgi:NMD protein affecting ribosome stability and mRNA decay
VISFVKRDIEKQKSKGIFLNNEEETSSGVNLYITNQTYAKVIARKVKEQFGAKVSFNETLFSMSKQTSRDIFRLTVLIELPNLSKTDMIVVNERCYQVTSVSKSISVIDLETGQKTALPRSDSIKEKQIVVPSVLAEVTLVNPRLEVLHPENFSSIPIENANRITSISNSTPKIGDKIRVAFDHDGRVWAFL